MSHGLLHFTALELFHDCPFFIHVHGKGCYSTFLMKRSHCRKPLYMFHCYMNMLWHVLTEMVLMHEIARIGLSIVMLSCLSLNFVEQSRWLFTEFNSCSDAYNGISFACSSKKPIKGPQSERKPNMSAFSQQMVVVFTSCHPPPIYS